VAHPHLFALHKAPSSFCYTISSSLFTDLDLAPHYLLIGLDDSVFFFNDPDVPLLTVVRELRSVGSDTAASVLATGWTERYTLSASGPEKSAVW
jgi:hypothetical protein